MFFFRWIRILPSLPFLWAGQLTAMFKLGVAPGLLEVAWHIGGQGRVGRMALGCLAQTGGSVAACAKARAWLLGHPCVEIASYAGLLAVEDDLPEARRCLALCRQLGVEDREGMVEMLEFLVASRCDDVAAAREVFERLGRRSDLSPGLTRMVLCGQMWQGMLAGEFPAASRLARRLLEVDDEPQAELVLWALSRHEGNHSAAERHLWRAAAAPPALRLYYQGLSSVVIGDRQGAEACLGELRDHDPAHAAQLHRLLNEGRRE